MESDEWGGLMGENTIEKRLVQLEQTFSEPNFLDNKGLGNEVGYYVFDYPPREELKVREGILTMREKFQSGAYGFTLLVFDLYDIVMDLLEQEGYRTMCEDFEEDKGFYEITSAINEMLRMEEDNCQNQLLAHIKENITEKSIIILTGVGKIFPLLRSHKILNNLHQFIDEIPVIMLFPGEYDGSSLNLFSKIKDDNYYRAFRIVD